MNKQGLIYVASPYYHDNHYIMEERWEITSKACYIMLQAGFHIISPIMHWHPTKKLGLQYGQVDDKLVALNVKLLNCCNEIVVLTLNGWKESLGVTAEIEYARTNNINLVYLSDIDLFNTLAKFGATGDKKYGTTD